uniref:serine/threonine-protein kinase RIO3-like n=1 Tax=Styela clava TaxID=7725 RepID=UPI001939C552|nr:serine/threonine-protein kinase RIO3-like [Styela clava]
MKIWQQGTMASSTKVIETVAVDTPNTSVLTTPDMTCGKSPGSGRSWSNRMEPLISFADVMSEQLADSIVQEEYQTIKDDFKEPIDDIETSNQQPIVLGDGFPDTSSDEALALMLQAEMDKEYNEYIAKEESRVNQYSKVKLSFDKYRASGGKTSTSSAEEDSDDDDDDDDMDENFMSHTKSSGNTIVTKHDKEICSRRNVARMEDSFPAGFLSGDARGMDLQLTNKIYNSLKQHAFSEQRRSQRIHEPKEHYTTEHAVDEKTRLILYRLVNHGILASVNGVISVGKESVVIHADGGDAGLLDESQKKTAIDLVKDAKVPSECAIKVYKTTLNEFRTRDKYIKDDYRFKDRFKKLNPRKIIHMWAEKEMRNLLRIKAAGISCPDVILLKKHVLVMSFLGVGQNPAPKLKDAVLSSTQRKSAYSQVKQIMHTLYHTCRLVHADLSEYNLLWNDQKVWVIDVSQSVEPNHPRGLEFLFRDCQNMSKFFRNCGVEDVADPMHLFNEVSELSLSVEDETSFRSEIERLQRITEEHSQQGLNKAKTLLQQ